MKRTLLLLACSLVAACSSAADNSSTDSDAGDVPAANGATPGSTPGSTPAGTDGGATLAPTGDDGGTQQPPTSTDPDGGAPSDSGSGGSTGSGVFGGDAGAYVPTLGTLADNPKHTGGTNPAGQACLSCHGGQRPNVVRFLFAGTAWSASAPTKPAAQVEVRIVESNGNAHSTYSDANGNFFFAAGGEMLSPPAMGGVRDGNGAQSMTNVFNDGDCNSCHHAGGQGPILAP